MGIKLIGTKKLPTVIGDGVCEVLTAKEFLCDTDADFASLPECCVSSMAVSIESGKVMVVNTAGSWVEFAPGGGSGSGSGSGTDDSIVGTWVFNDELNFEGFGTDIIYPLNFADANGNPYIGLSYGELTDGVYRLRFMISEDGRSTDVYRTDELWGQPKGWSSETFYTITIIEEPTDEFIKTWLRSNGKKSA